MHGFDRGLLALLALSVIGLAVAVVILVGDDGDMVRHAQFVGHVGHLERLDADLRHTVAKPRYSVAASRERLLHAERLRAAHDSLRGALPASLAIEEAYDRATASLTHRKPLLERVVAHNISRLRSLRALAASYERARAEAPVGTQRALEMLHHGVLEAVLLEDMSIMLRVHSTMSRLRTLAAPPQSLQLYLDHVHAVVAGSASSHQLVGELRRHDYVRALVALKHAEARVFSTRQKRASLTRVVVLAVTIVALLGVLIALVRLRQARFAIKANTDALQREIMVRRETEEALQQARDDAVAASLAKSAFLANMSHELRTPLNAIIGYTELIAEDADDLGIHDFDADLDRVTASAKHLLHLINEVLDLSKIEAGKLELVLQRFELTPFLRELVDGAGPLVAKQYNRLVLEDRAEVGTLVADRTKLTQSLLNLLGNAAKFTEQGVITLRSQRELRRGEAYLVLSISDTGRGIPRDKQANLFDAFAQAHDTSKMSIGGTGLGLTITRHLVSMMGGELSFVSEEDVGSTFYIALPLAQLGA